MIRFNLYISLFLVIIFNVQPCLSQSQTEELIEQKVLNMMHESASVERDSTILISMLEVWDSRLPLGQSDFKETYVDFLNLEITNSKWPKAHAYSLWLQGIVHLSDNRLYNAFDFLEKSMLEFKAMNDSYNYGLVNNKLVPLMNWNMIENKIEDDSKLKYSTYINDAVIAAEQTGNIYVLANLKITSASYSLFVLENFEETLSVIDEIKREIESKDRLEWFDFYYITILGEALAKLNLGQEREGKALLDQIITACDQNTQSGKAQYVRGQLAAFVGRYFLNKKQYKEAYRYAVEAEKGISYLNFPYFLNYLNKTLFEVYKYNGESGKALSYLEKVTDYQKQVESNKLNQKVLEWQLVYETEKQNNIIKTLENENLLQSRDRNKLLLNSLISLLILALISTIFILRGRNKLKIKNLELKQKNLEISKAMLKGQNQERRRVASELHDNLNTKIAALKWRFETLESQKALSQEKIDSFVNILNDIYLDIRLISHNLIPEDLEKQGIVTAIQKLINSLSDHHINFNFIKKGLKSRPPILIEYQIYNIILELINNVLKHSQATQCWISLSNSNEEVILSVSDNGIGMQEHLESKGVGLKNISSRVKHLNGSLVFPAHNAKGFIVAITIPVPSG